jgi:hypothetical protein
MLEIVPSPQFLADKFTLFGLVGTEILTKSPNFFLTILSSNLEISSHFCGLLRIFDITHTIALYFDG